MRDLEQLAALHESNRRVADPQVERMLRQLRGSLFARSTAVSQLPVAGLRDPGSVPFGVPSTTRTELDCTRIRQAIATHGSLHVRGLLDPRRVDHMRGVIDAALDAQEFAYSTPPPSPSPWFDPSDLVNGGEIARQFVRRSAAVLAVDSPRGFYQLLDLMFELGIDQLVAAYFGERPALSGEKTTLRRIPPGADDSGWHQDGAFLGTNIRSLNLWIALTDCDGSVPGLEFVPTRLEHIVEMGTPGSDFAWCVAPSVVEAQFPGAAVRPAFKAGDALFFDHFLLHRAWRTPTMLGRRYALENWFFAPSAYPDSQTGLIV